MEVRGAAMLESAAASSILFRLALGKPRLAQAFDDALVLRLVGRIIAHVPSGPGLYGVAGLNCLQLSDGLLRLLVAPGPSVGGSELDLRIKNLREARDRLLAAWYGLVPLLEVIVQDAQIELPPRRARVTRTQSKRGPNLRKAVLGAADIHLQETNIRMGVGVIGVQRNRGFKLRIRWS